MAVRRSLSFLSAVLLASLCIAPRLISNGSAPCAAASRLSPTSPFSALHPDTSLTDLRLAPHPCASLCLAPLSALHCDRSPTHLRLAAQPLASLYLAPLSTLHHLRSQTDLDPAPHPLTSLRLTPLAALGCDRSLTDQGCATQPLASLRRSLGVSTPRTSLRLGLGLISDKFAPSSASRLYAPCSTTDLRQICALCLSLTSTMTDLRLIFPLRGSLSPLSALRLSPPCTRIDLRQMWALRRNVSHLSASRLCHPCNA